MLHTWKVDVVYFQVTKLIWDIPEIVKEVWGNNWVNHIQLEASEGIVIMQLHMWIFRLSVLTILKSIPTSLYFVYGSFSYIVSYFS